MRRLFLITAALVGLSGLLGGCLGDSSNDGPTTLAQTVAADPDLATLNEALTATGLTPVLSGSTDHTLFAPSNAAFAALLTELGVTKAQLFADVPLLTAVLQYHVLDGKVSQADVPLGHAITPVGGGFFKIDLVAMALKATDGRNRIAGVTTTDIAATNGVMHKLDRVLLPADKDVVATAIATPEFSTLVEALTAADLVTTLQGSGPFTVFAPTNAAFDALFAEMGMTKDQVFADTATLTRILTYHVLGARVLKADVPVATDIATLEGAAFQVNAAGGALVITDQSLRSSTITGTDILASNGVIHVVDHVLVPLTRDIVATAIANPDFSTLVEALSAANLVTTLQGPGPFTVFAPTNAAFDALFAELGTTKDALFADTALLTKVLTYHVLGAQVLAAQVPIGTPITTLETDTFTVDGSYLITDSSARTSQITATNVLATNGVIHVIDKVLLPAN